MAAGAFVGWGYPVRGGGLAYIMCKSFKLLANIKKSVSHKNSDFCPLLINLDYLANPVADIPMWQRSGGGG